MWDSVDVVVSLGFLLCLLRIIIISSKNASFGADAETYGLNVCNKLTVWFFMSLVAICHHNKHSGTLASVHLGEQMALSAAGGQRVLLWVQHISNIIFVFGYKFNLSFT